MKYQIYSVPIVGGFEQQEEMNKFIGSHKIVNVEKSFITLGNMAYVTFCVEYVDGGVSQHDQHLRVREKVDYSKTLNDEDYKTFLLAKSVRKKIADARGVPAYNVMRDDELAKVVMMKPLTNEGVRALDGFNEKRMTTYIEEFIKEFNESLLYGEKDPSPNGTDNGAGQS